MSVTRHQTDFNSTVEWTESILEIPNTSSFIKEMGLFKVQYTNQSSVVFDKITTETRLLAQVDRRGGNPTRGTDRKVETFSLPLAYFHDIEPIVKADFENKRMPGTADQEDTLANVISEKLADQRIKVDQTHEYMMLQAIKGITTTPDGAVLANMFTEFGVTQVSIDFALGTSTTNVKAKCAEVKDTLQKNLKTGARFSGNIPVIVDRLFFDKLVNHASVKEAYLNSQSNVAYQAARTTYLTWGITDAFVFHGLEFMVFAHTFVLPDGTTDEAVADNTGHVIPKLGGNQSIFRAIYGPSNKLNSTGGQEMFAWEFRDPRQTFHEIEAETFCLFFAEKPLTLIELTTN